MKYSFANVFFIKQRSLRQPTAHCQQKKQKDYGINTSPTHKAIFYSVSFWFFICLRWRDAYKKITIMQKQLRIISSRRLAVCPFSLSFSTVPTLPSWVFSKHVGRRAVYYRYRKCRVFVVSQSGWYLHCYPTGRRQLSALPF